MKRSMARLTPDPGWIPRNQTGKHSVVQNPALPLPGDRSHTGVSKGGPFLQSPPAQLLPAIRLWLTGSLRWICGLLTPRAPYISAKRTNRVRDDSRVNATHRKRGRPRSTASDGTPRKAARQICTSRMLPTPSNFPAR